MEGQRHQLIWPAWLGAVLVIDQRMAIRLMTRPVLQSCMISPLLQQVMLRPYSTCKIFMDNSYSHCSDLPLYHFFFFFKRRLITTSGKVVVDAFRNSTGDVSLGKCLQSPCSFMG